jgi:uncharacterized ion transporter superfamily protein YfcC
MHHLPQVAELLKHFVVLLLLMTFFVPFGSFAEIDVSNSDKLVPTVFSEIFVA